MPFSMIFLSSKFHELLKGCKWHLNFSWFVLVIFPVMQFCLSKNHSTSWSLSSWYCQLSLFVILVTDAILRFISSCNLTLYWLPLIYWTCLGFQAGLLTFDLLSFLSKISLHSHHVNSVHLSYPWNIRSYKSVLFASSIHHKIELFVCLVYCITYTSKIIDVRFSLFVNTSRSQYRAVCLFVLLYGRMIWFDSHLTSLSALSDYFRLE